MTGIIKFYNKKKGFGFIAADNGEEYFFHISNVVNKRIPIMNQVCSFETNETNRRIQAVNVKMIPIA